MQERDCKNCKNCQSVRGFAVVCERTWTEFGETINIVHVDINDTSRRHARVCEHYEEQGVEK